MMDNDKAMGLLERGEADGILVSVLLLRSRGHIWLSFDGNEWEVIDSELIRKQFVI